MLAFMSSYKFIELLWLLLFFSSCTIIRNSVFSIKTKTKEKKNIIENCQIKRYIYYYCYHCSKETKNETCQFFSYNNIWWYFITIKIVWKNQNAIFIFILIIMYFDWCFCCFCCCIFISCYFVSDIFCKSFTWSISNPTSILRWLDVFDDAPVA